MPGIFDTPISRKRFVAASAVVAGASLQPQHCFSDDTSSSARLALLSDTHIPQSIEDGYRGFVPAENLQKVAQQVAESAGQAAVVNGDAARLAGFREDYVVLKELLSPIAEKMPVHIGLGNHDDRKNFFEVFPQEDDRKELVRGKHVSRFELGGTRFVVLD